MRSLLTDDPEMTLFALTEQMASKGVSLVPRVIPQKVGFQQWTHYPANDAISPSTKARWFYHAHPPEQRSPGEHGHFHLFLPLDSFEGIEPIAKPKSKNKKGKSPAKVVHFIALSCNLKGIPTHWFTTNHWVTDEYFMDAGTIIERLGQFDVRDANGDSLVNGWLTAAVAVFEEQIADLIHQRDTALIDQSLDDPDLEILSSGPLEI